MVSFALFQTSSLCLHATHTPELLSNILNFRLGEHMLHNLGWSRFQFFATCFAKAMTDSVCYSFQNRFLFNDLDCSFKDFPKCGDASTHILSDYNRISVSLLDRSPEGSPLIPIRSGYKRYPRTIDSLSRKCEAGGGGVAEICRGTTVCTIRAVHSYILECTSSTNSAPQP